MRVLCPRDPLSSTGLLWAPLLLSASFLAGCNSYQLGNLSNAASIAAPSTGVRVTQTLQLTGQSLSVGMPLTFYVDGIQGGNATVGTINSAGLYTAPATIPSPDSVTITSTSNQYPTAPKGQVSVEIWNPVPVLGNVTPGTFAEGSTTVAVDGSQFIYGAEISWNGKIVPTTWVSATELVAQIDEPNPGTYPLTVTNPNPGSASAPAIPLKVGPGRVILSLYTGGDSDVRVSNSVSFSLNVNGTDNTAVTVAINGIQGGNSTIGTVVAKNGTITYTAPAVVPTPSNIVQLTIVSVDNPTVGIAQNISVMNPIPILTTATPSSFAPGTSTSIALTGQQFITGAQVLVNGAAVPTTFTSGTQLSATIDISQPGNLDLQVLNPAPGPSTSADLIATVTGTPPVPIVEPPDAARFLEQATMGPNDSDIRHLSMVGYQAWLNEQFAIPQTPAEPIVEQALTVNSAPCAAGNVQCNAALFVQNNQNEDLVQAAFWQQSLTGQDELRERVKYALTQMFVISSNNATTIQNMPRGEAGYYDMLGNDAFGNFRQLLQDVTLSPMMGQFLNALMNDKGNATTDPDENYAREVMQLFTIGLWQLNDDGTQKLSGGQPIATYSNTDVMGLAAVFTGFSWNVPGDDSDSAWSNCCLYVGPGYGEELLSMQAYPSHHSTVEKQFLGVTIPASGTPDTEGDLKIALDTLFNHPNLPAFFSKQMIQHLVTSNPSPAYVNRVAQVFKDDGTGVRGNLQAVLSAILLDPEARDTATAQSNPQYGKVRESLLRYTEWARAFTAQSRTGSYDLGSTEDPIYGLGEMWLRSPTVFNWFAPGYVPPASPIATDGLVAPEMQMTNVSSVVGYINYLQGAIGANAQGGPDLFAAYGAEMSRAATPDQLMDRINLLLMYGQMSTSLYNQIETAVASIPIPTGSQAAINAALLSRVQTAIYLTVASPDYAAQE